MDKASALASSPTKAHQRSAYSGPTSAAPEAVWTASRCNRLLRPIGSRINLLRKHRKNGSFPVGLGLVNQTEEHAIPHCASQGSRICTVNRSSLGLERRSHRNDPDWVPGSELRKKVKHKYSSRGIEGGRQLAGGSRGIKARAQSRQLSPNDSTVPTPYLSKNRGGSGDEYPDDRGEARPSARNGPSSASGCERRRPRVPCLGNPSSQLPAALLQRLKRLTEHSSWALIEGIVIGFDALLKVTAAPLPQGRDGARSLFSMCLRRVPEYIAEEQEWQQEESENDQLDVSSEVYADLEEFGCSQGHGWVHLSEVVRAHGVALLSDAIREGLLTQDAARALVQLCIHHTALDEAELLVASLVFSQIPHHKPGMAHCETSEHQMSAALSTLNLFAQQTGRHEFHYRQVDSLLVTGLLPVERLASRDLITLWGNAIRTISQVGGNSTDAVGLLCTAITLACDCSSPVQDLIHSIRLSPTAKRGKHGGKTRRATLRRSRSITRLIHHSGRESKIKTCTNSGVDAALSKLVSRLLTILSATALSQAQNPERSSNGAGDIRAIAGLAMIVRGNSELKHTEDPACAHSKERTALVFMADSLLPLALQSSAERSFNHTTTLSRPPLAVKVGLPQHVTSVSSSLDDLASYVNSIACCAGRILQEDGFGHTQILSDYLVSLLIPTNTSSAQLSSLERQAFAYVGLQSASLFAKENPGVTHFEYAEKIAQLAHSQGLDEASLSRQGCGSYSKRFRWEEGIEEWVAITPASNHKKRKICASGSTVWTESEDEGDGTEASSSISHDTEITDPEHSSDVDELDGLPIAQDSLRKGCRTTRAQTGLILCGNSRKKRITGEANRNKAQGKGNVIRWVGEVESEDELSFS